MKSASDCSLGILMVPIYSLLLVITRYVIMKAS